MDETPLLILRGSLKLYFKTFKTKQSYVSTQAGNSVTETSVKNAIAATKPDNWIRVFHTFTALITEKNSSQYWTITHFYSLANISR
jgi:hypothetical protein